MEKIVVTGSEGFIGSHVMDELLMRGYEPVGFDIKNTPREDVRDPHAVIEVLEDADAVLHLAAEPYIPDCYDSPRLFFDTNSIGTLNVLWAAKKYNLRMVYWSSSEIYGTAQTLPMNESHPTNPHSTYAVSKLAADRLCYTYYKEHDVKVTMLRQFNCYGPREYQPYVIPTMIEQMAKGPDLYLGNVKAERDFTYVADAAMAGVDLMECPEAIGETVNVGYGNCFSIEEIAMMIQKIMRPVSLVTLHLEEERFRPYDVDRLLCDNTRMTELTGWTPRTDFESGLEETIAWFRANGEKWPYQREREL